MLDDERYIAPELNEAGRVVRKGYPNRGDNAPVAWCSPHDCHPEECFELHYPDAHAK